MSLEIFRWAKEVCFNPKGATKKDLDYGTFIRRLLVVSLVPGVLLTLITIFAAGAFGDEAAAFGGMSAFFYIPLFLVSAVVNPFVNGAIIHFFGKIVFRLMKKEYKRTYNASAYGMLPSFLFGWIPVIGSLVGGIWSIIVEVYAISNQHGVKPSRALLIVLIPVIIVLVLTGLFLGTAFTLFGPEIFGTDMPMMGAN